MLLIPFFLFCFSGFFFLILSLVKRGGEKLEEKMKMSETKREREREREPGVVRSVDYIYIYIYI